jgi:hypothetical protein
MGEKEKWGAAAIPESTSAAPYVHQVLRMLAAP